MNVMVLAIAVLIVIVAVIAAVSLLLYRRQHRHNLALHQLLNDADHLEADLKECRQRLDRAHAVMATAPGAPVTGETDARQAVDAGLRSLLEHRLWIRDYSGTASQKELDDAVDALSRARAKLEPQLRALDIAQRELEQAVRERIERES